MDGDGSPSSLLREAENKVLNQLPAKPVLRHGCEQCSPPLRYLSPCADHTSMPLIFLEIPYILSVFRGTVALSWNWLGFSSLPSRGRSLNGLEAELHSLVPS